MEYTVSFSKAMRICSHCNTDFELVFEHNAMVRQSVCNHQNCPHCGRRNDIWVAISWPSEQELEANAIETAANNAQQVWLDAVNAPQSKAMVVAVCEWLRGQAAKTRRLTQKD